MPIAVAKHGFWWINSTDRAITKSKNTLILYDPSSAKLNYYTDSGDVNPTSIQTVIAARETSLGLIPTKLGSYSTFLSKTDAQVADYCHIWDVGYDTVIPSAVKTKYKTYLQSGGALFLFGENNYFAQRNASIIDFVGSVMGGGSVSVDSSTSSTTAQIQSQFLLANPSASVSFDACNQFVLQGNGVTMVKGTGTLTGTIAAVWKRGTLSQAPTGCMCVIFDINWADGSIRTQNNLVDNISVVLNNV